MVSYLASWIGRLEEDPTISYAYGTPRKEEIPSEFHFICWNVYKGKRKNFVEEFQRLIIGNQCDLYALQEAWTGDDLDYGIGQMTSQFLKKGKPSGTFNGSPVRTQQVQNFRTEIIEPIVGTPKSATLTKYKCKSSTSSESKEITLINFHWLNWTSDEDWKMELQKILKEIPNSGPLLIAGDFNTSNEWRINYLQNSLVQEKGLSLDLKANYNRKKILDFIFSRDLQVKKTNIITTDASDHPLLSIQYSIL